MYRAKRYAICALFTLSRTCLRGPELSYLKTLSHATPCNHLGHGLPCSCHYGRGTSPLLRTTCRICRAQIRQTHELSRSRMDVWRVRGYRPPTTPSKLRMFLLLLFNATVTIHLPFARRMYKTLTSNLALIAFDECCALYCTHMRFGQKRHLAHGSLTYR